VVSLSMSHSQSRVISLIWCFLSVYGIEDDFMRAGSQGEVGSKARIPTQDNRISNSGIIALSFAAVTLAVIILVYCLIKIKFCFSKRGTANLDVNDNRVTCDPAEIMQRQCCNHAPPPYPGLGVRLSYSGEAPPRYSSLFQPPDYAV